MIFLYTKTDLGPAVYFGGPRRPLCRAHSTSGGSYPMLELTLEDFLTTTVNYECRHLRSSYIVHSTSKVCPYTTIQSTYKVPLSIQLRSLSSTCMLQSTSEVLPYTRVNFGRYHDYYSQCLSMLRSPHILHSIFEVFPLIKFLSLYIAVYLGPLSYAMYKFRHLISPYIVHSTSEVFAYTTLQSTNKIPLSILLWSLRSSCILQSTCEVYLFTTVNLWCLLVYCSWTLRSSCILRSNSSEFFCGTLSYSF